MKICNQCGAPKVRLASGRLACPPCKAEYDKARRIADPEPNRLRCQAYAEQHREESRERAREWRAANHERAKAAQAASYQVNRDAERLKRREHYLANAEVYKRRARESTWRQDNPEGAAALAHRRRARKRAAVCEHGERCVGADFLRTLYASACTYCGDRAEHADHFQPLTRGGLHCRHNLVPSCGPCNTSKNARDPLEWMTERGIDHSTGS